MIKVTRWSPDTCDCVVEYSWDTEVPQDQRVHTPGEVLRKCEAHKDDTKAKVHSKLKDENTRKNLAIAEITALLPEFNKPDADGNPTPDMTKIKWSFDIDRNLQVDLKGIKAADKIAVRAVLQAKFPNKADII